MTDHKFPPRIWVEKENYTAEDDDIYGVAFKCDLKQGLTTRNLNIKKYLSLEEHYSIVAGLRE